MKKVFFFGVFKKVGCLNEFVLLHWAINHNMILHTPKFTTSINMCILEVFTEKKISYLLRLIIQTFSSTKRWNFPPGYLGYFLNYRVIKTDSPNPLCKTLWRVSNFEPDFIFSVLEMYVNCEKLPYMYI